MKKRLVIFLGCLVMLTCISLVSGVPLTGEAITGRAMSNVFGISVDVSASAPSLTVHSPKNGTFLTGNLLLNYSVSGAYKVWYVLDNGTNVSLDGSLVFLNVSSGRHTLKVHAENADNVFVDRDINFSVNLNKTIIYTEYQVPSTKGSSTDFVRYTYEELSSLNGIILENTAAGKIAFSQGIDVLDVPSDVIDLDENTQISFASVQINSTNLSNFDVPAVITMYNLPFISPRIKKDGVACLSPACTIQRYSGGTLTFVVLGFSTYTVEENTGYSGWVPGGGSSGDDDSSSDDEYEIPAPSAPAQQIKSEIKGLSISKGTIVVKLLQGETKREEIILTNTEKNKSLSFSVEVEGIAQFVKLAQTQITLAPGESKNFVMDVLAREDTIPASYIGKLVFSTTSAEQEIFMAVDVSSRKSLFDVQIEVPRKSLQIFPGEDLLANVRLLNFGDKGRIDALIIYEIVDEHGKAVMTAQEYLAVDTQVSFTKNFQLPDTLEAGTYHIRAIVSYESEKAVASTFFYVIERETLVDKAIRNWWIILLVVVGLLTLHRYFKKGESIG